MYNFIFTMLTDPLGLPISPLWEYAILAVLNLIAYKIAWDASPGGVFGSEIHWIVRLFVFVAIWAFTYGAIAAVQWLYANWVLVLSVMGGLFLISFILFLSIRYAKRRKNEAPSTETPCR